MLALSFQVDSQRKTMPVTMSVTGQMLVVTAALATFVVGEQACPAPDDNTSKSRCLLFAQMIMLIYFQVLSQDLMMMIKVVDFYSSTKPHAKSRLLNAVKIRPAERVITRRTDGSITVLHTTQSQFSSHAVQAGKRQLKKMVM